MSDKTPDTPGRPGQLRHDVEQKVDELELRLAAVERHLAERARLALDRGDMRRSRSAAEDESSEPPEHES